MVAASTTSASVPPTEGLSHPAGFQVLPSHGRALDARHGIVPASPAARGRPVHARAGDSPRSPDPRDGPARSICTGGVRAGRQSASWMAAATTPLGVGRRFGDVPGRQAQTRTCSSSTTAMCSPRPGWRRRRPVPALVRRDRAPRWPTGRPPAACPPWRDGGQAQFISGWCRPPRTRPPGRPGVALQRLDQRLDRATRPPSPDEHTVLHPPSAMRPGSRRPMARPAAHRAGPRAAGDHGLSVDEVARRPASARVRCASGSTRRWASRPWLPAHVDPRRDAFWFETLRLRPLSGLSASSASSARAGSGRFGVGRADLRVELRSTNTR